MQRWMGRLGGGFLLLFCAAGLAGWAMLPGRISVVFGEGGGAADRAPVSDLGPELLLEELAAAESRTLERFGALEDRLGEAFAALEPPFQGLLAQGTSQEERLQDLGRQMAELGRRIDTLQARQEALLTMPLAGQPAPPTGDEEPAIPAEPVTEPDPAVTAAPPPPDEADTQVKSPISFTQLFQRAEQTPKGANRVRFVLVEGGSKVGFDGSSNLHDFSGSTTQVEGELEFAPAQPDRDPSAWVRIQAPSLVTGDEDRDEEMHEHHLQSAEHPEISFRLTSLTDLVHETDRVFTATGHGTFLCHGVAKEVTVPVKVERVGSSTVRMTGEWKMLMSDHGIDPPKALGGLITTSDEVLAWFHLQARAAR